MTVQKPIRASGRTAAQEATKEAAQEAEQPVEPQLDVERRRRFQSPGFTRMPLEWGGEDQLMMARIHAAVHKRIQTEFADLLDLWFDLVVRVRELEVDPETGEAVPDKDGYPTFKRSASGAYIEHWDALTGRIRERYLFQITTSLVEWEQRATALWAEAMMAKAQWEEAYGLGFESLDLPRATIQDREARAKVDSAQARYFAVFVSYYSRMAEGLVRNMGQLGQRLKDVHVAASGR